MMRYSIYEGEKEVVTLKAEVDYLKNYIELHKMRYHKEIDVKFEAEIEDDYKVMPLLFIILLENAFKHGIENLSKDAYVHLNIKAKNNEVFFEIENNFDHTQAERRQGYWIEKFKTKIRIGVSKKTYLNLVYKRKCI